MADSDKVFDLLHRQPGIVSSALPPNQKGFESALAGRIYFSIKGFGQNNINCSISESLKRFESVLAAPVNTA